jgi:hypothetical protein
MRDSFTLVNNAAAGAWVADAAGNVALTPGFVVPLTELISSVMIDPAVGVAATFDFTLAGTYVAGDEVKLTVVSNETTRQLWRKTYTHIVQVGAVTVTNIADAFVLLMSADALATETPYTASNVAGVISITSKSDDAGSLQGFAYATSTAGTAVAGATSFTASEGQPDDLRDEGVAESDITGASYDTVRILYRPKVAQPFINSAGANEVEIYWFGTPGVNNGAGDAGNTGGADLNDLINA